MPEPHTLAVFALTSFALIVVPGPAVLYVVARSLEQGRAAGFVSVLGIGLGELVHFIGAAVGLSALLAASAVAFATIKVAGAAYLIYLGLRTLLAPTPVEGPQAAPPQPLRTIFVQGVFVSATNPKVALFVLAFLPQFLDPERGPLALQALALGVVFVLIAFLSDGLYVLLAGSLGTWLRRRPAFLGLRRYISGTAYLGLGVAAAATGWSRE